MLNYAYKSQPLPFPKLFHSQGNQAINLQLKKLTGFPVGGTLGWNRLTVNIPSIANLSLFSGILTIRVNIKPSNLFK